MTLLKRLSLDYDDFAKHFKVEGGNLVRLIDARRTKAGQIVGCPNNEGYLKFGHKGKVYSVHRVIYLLTHKEDPECVDHINGNVADNRPENLRAAVIQTNAYNAKIQVNNTSGCKGVHHLKDGHGYQANINYNGKRKFLGTFKTFEDAKEFISLAREMVHGEFANHGVAHV
jgi:HNH endonuclease